LRFIAEYRPNTYDGRLRNASFDTSRGFGLRCVAGETSGFAQGTELTPAALTRAANAVSLAKDGYSGMASAAPARTNAHLYPDIERVVQVSVTMSGSRRAISILRAGGERYDDIRPLVRLNIQITAEKDGLRENGYAGAGGRQSYDSYIDPAFWKPLAKEALRGALVNLRSVPAPAGQMDVVLGPGWPGVLLHEAMGHGWPQKVSPSSMTARSMGGADL